MKQTNYKIIKSLGILMLVAALFGSLAVTASAQTAQSKPFLSGYNLQVVASTTNLFAATNTYSKGYTVTNSSTYPYTSSISPLIVTNAGALVDVALWADRDGSSPAANISVQIHGTNAAFTNIAVLTFAALPVDPRSPNYPPGQFVAGTSAQNQFTFTVTGQGTTNVCIATNLPTGFLQGSRGLRLSSVVWTNAGAGGFVDGIFLNGFTPTP